MIVEIPKLIITVTARMLINLAIDEYDDLAQGQIDKLSLAFFGPSSMPPLDPRQDIMN